MPFLPLDLLRTGASELGVELSDHQLELLDEFALLLTEANRWFNLTRITEPAQIVTGHYLDSLLFLSATEVAPGSRVIDIGTGPGLPGVPMKIVRPDLIVTLVDATSKKTGFVLEAMAKLGLEGVVTVSARAEELAHNEAHREQYDVACARALSELKVLAELCLPFVRVGGRVLASKSTDIDAEIDAARPIIGHLGGLVEKTVRTHIPATDVARRIVVIGKSKPTPEQFPRAYAQITRHKRQRPSRSA